MKTIVLVDGKNQIYRHHFAHLGLSTRKGFPTGAIHGCLTSMISLSEKLHNPSFVWVWDGAGETWRHKLMSSLPRINVKHRDPPLPLLQGGDENETSGTLSQNNGLNETSVQFLHERSLNHNFCDSSVSMEEDFIGSSVESSLAFLGLTKKEQIKRTFRPKVHGYKANREPPEMGEKARAIAQLQVLKMILNGSGFCNFEVPGLECDDLLAILAKFVHDAEDDYQIVILSGDRDFYQLLEWDRVRILKGSKEGKLEWVDANNVIDRFGVAPDGWLQYRALTGDSGDNIPHLWKVGPKTALKMLDAGIDPSVEEITKLPIECFEKFQRYFEPDGPLRMWPLLHANYRLCRLVTDYQDRCLSEEVRRHLKETFRYIRTPKDLMRDKKRVTSEAYRRVTSVLWKYELAEVIGKRRELWGIN